MTKDMIKAIRLCLGYNTDLRHELPPYSYGEGSCFQQAIMDFIENNLIGLYGDSIYSRLGIDINPKARGDYDEYEKLMHFIEWEAVAVCTGKENGKPGKEN